MNNSKSAEERVLSGQGFPHPAQDGWNGEFSNLTKQDPLQAALQDLKVHQEEILDWNKDLRIAQEELIASHMKYVDLFESAPVGIMVMDFQGMILEANKALAGLLGQRRKDLQGSLWTEYVASSSQYALGDHLAKTERLGRSSEELVLKGDHGTGPIIELDSASYYDSSVKSELIRSVVKDVTRRKQVETEKERMIERLKEALNRLTTLAGLIPVCAHCKDIRDERGEWQQLEAYLWKHTGLEFTHTLCPACATKLYPDLYGEEKTMS